MDHSQVVLKVPWARLRPAMTSFAFDRSKKSSGVDTGMAELAMSKDLGVARALFFPSLWPV